MKINVETFLQLYGAQNNICTCSNCLSMLRIRPYSCPCDGAQCAGWQMIHDARVLMAVAMGRVSVAEVSAYRRQLGKRYNTTPWIDSATKLRRHRYK